VSTVIYLVFALAMVLAWAVAARRTEHRPIAALLSAGLAASAACTAWNAIMVEPLRAALGTATPWSGWPYVAGTILHALVFVWPAALVGAALVVFARRSPWPAILAWAMVVFAFGLVHPAARGQVFAHQLAELAATLTAAGLWTAWARRRVQPTSAHYAMSAVIVVELMSRVAEWRGGTLADSQVLYLVMLAVLVLMQGYAVLQRVAAVERRQDVAEKSNLKAHIIAAAAVRTAERAEQHALEARDLADNIPTAAPPSSRRPASTQTTGADVAPPSSRRGSTTPTTTS
jgi:hypothetical protein